MTLQTFLREGRLPRVSHQGEDGQEPGQPQRGADGRAVEEQVGKGEGAEQDAEEHRHPAGDGAQPVERR